MCNEYSHRVAYSRYVEEFSQLKLPVLVEGNGPDLTARDIRIRDTAPVVLRGSEGVQLTELVWAPRAASGKPTFNFRSERRSFAKSTRCLIPASAFFEFTTPADPKRKRKDKWRFTLAGADWFCVAGIVRPDARDGAACFTMLTTEPGPDVAPYHDRQVVVLPREDWIAWLDLTRPEADLLRPLPGGALEVALEHADPQAGKTGRAARP
jgi:putative SOS response-associated peptidase YedK